VTAERLSRAWTPEEVAKNASHIDASLPEAVTVSRTGDPLAHVAGAQHRPGREVSTESVTEAEYPEERLREPQPTRPSSYEGT
jgi:hypothetical protein